MFRASPHAPCMWNMHTMPIPCELEWITLNLVKTTHDHIPVGACVDIDHNKLLEESIPDPEISQQGVGPDKWPLYRGLVTC